MRQSIQPTAVRFSLVNHCLINEVMHTHNVFTHTIYSLILVNVGMYRTRIPRLIFKRFHHNELIQLLTLLEVSIVCKGSFY